MSRHKEAYVISYHEALCHDMSYVTTIVASLDLGGMAFLIPVFGIEKIPRYPVFN